MTEISSTIIVFREAPWSIWLPFFLKAVATPITLFTYGTEAPLGVTALEESYDPEAVAARLLALRPKHVVLLSNQAGLMCDAAAASLLRAAGVRVTAQGATAAALGSSKIRAKALFLQLGISTPEGSSATSVAEAARLADDIGYPAVIKVANLSEGRKMFLANTPADIERGFRDHAIHEPVLVERYIRGREASAIVLRSGARQIIFPVVWKPSTDYLASGTPVLGRPYQTALRNFPPEGDELTLASGVHDLAERASAAFENELLLGCDIVVDESGVPYLLEVNARMTETLRMSMLAADVNIFSLLLDDGEWPSEQRLPIARPIFDLANARFPAVVESLGSAVSTVVPGETRTSFAVETASARSHLLAKLRST